MAPIEPFEISVPDSKLEIVRKKLELTTFPDELEDSEWAYGAPLADIKRLHHHWLNSYDWRAQERTLNETLPQYTTDINVDGFGSLKIHFVYQKSESAKAIPLLFSHGWPGSFLEVAKILPELVKGGKEYPAFHVVAPSLPNYAFSEGVKKKGFAIPQYAEVCHKLMQTLGYTTYVTQGGDWGYFITRTMGIRYPESVKASHINFPLCKPPSYTQPLRYLSFLTTPFSETDKARLDRAKWFQVEGSGYNKEQSTKPQTIGYSLTDSPVGLLAWIYEKLHDWTDSYPWTDDEVLTWISIYQFSTAGPAAASRIYYENMHDPKKLYERVTEYTQPKLGIANFPKELNPTPDLWHSSLGDIVYQSTHDHGGHFAAHERPEEIVNDLRTMFGKGGGAYGVIEGKNGYDADARL